MKYDRIKKNTEFQKIFSGARKGFSARLTLLYLPSDGMKMGICVSKKHGNSVTRNRIKRIVREIFRLHADQLKENFSYVFLPKKADEYDYHALERDFLHIMEKQKLFKNPRDKEKKD